MGEPGLWKRPMKGITRFGGEHERSCREMLRAGLRWLESHPDSEPMFQGLLVGGAIGNIVDRLRAGSVTDFIKLPLGWPPFNLADASITVGILILLALIETARRPEA